MAAEPEATRARLRIPTPLLRLALDAKDRPAQRHRAKPVQNVRARDGGCRPQPRSTVLFPVRSRWPSPVGAAGVAPVLVRRCRVVPGDVRRLPPDAELGRRETAHDDQGRSQPELVARDLDPGSSIRAWRRAFRLAPPRAGRPCRPRAAPAIAPAVDGRLRASPRADALGRRPSPRSGRGTAPGSSGTAGRCRRR